MALSKQSWHRDCQWHVSALLRVCSWAARRTCTGTAHWRRSHHTTGAVVAHWAGGGGQRRRPVPAPGSPSRIVYCFSVFTNPFRTGAAACQAFSVFSCGTGFRVREEGAFKPPTPTAMTLQRHRGRPQTRACAAPSQREPRVLQGRVVIIVCVLLACCSFRHGAANATRRSEARARRPRTA
jgi:hypothetical protein